MAGAGYKLFTTGSVLTAAEVNTYLNEQTVMVFNDATARTTALSGVLAEGMVSYLKDTNATEVYDGSAWVGIGSSGDITGVTAGTGISGGGTSGTVTITNAMATEITASGDIIVGTGSGTFDNLPIGTTGQVLTADTTVSPYKVKWATPAAGDSWTLLNTGGTSLSGSSNTRIQSLSGSYQMLHIFIQDATCASLNDFSVRFNNDSGANKYFTAQRFRYSDNSSNDITSTNATSASLGSVQNGDVFVYISIPNYANTSTWKVAHIVACRNDVINGVQAGGILWKDTSAITEFDVISGANLTGGTCFIYGEK